MRPSVLGQDRSQAKIISLGPGLGLAVMVLCCETRSCHARHHNDLQWHGNSQVLFIVSQFRAWNDTAVEINSGVYLLKS